MKGLIEEYGGVIVLVIVVGFVLVGVYTGINLWFTQVFPDLSIENLESVSKESTGPVLLIEPIEIKSGTIITQELCIENAKAYNDSDLSQEVEIKVTGIEGVDTQICGLYQLLFTVEDTQGQLFRKVVPILIY